MKERICNKSLKIMAGTHTRAQTPRSFPHHDISHHDNVVAFVVLVFVRNKVNVKVFPTLPRKSIQNESGTNFVHVVVVISNPHPVSSPLPHTSSPHPFSSFLCAFMMQSKLREYFKGRGCRRTVGWIEGFAKRKFLWRNTHKIRIHVYVCCYE